MGRPDDGVRPDAGTRSPARGGPGIVGGRGVRWLDLRGGRSADDSGLAGTGAAANGGAQPWPGTGKSGRAVFAVLARLAGPVAVALRPGRREMEPAISGRGRTRVRWRANAGASPMAAAFGGLRLAGPDVDRGGSRHALDVHLEWAAAVRPMGRGLSDAQGGPRRDAVVGWSVRRTGRHGRNPSVAIGLDSGLGPTTWCAGWPGVEANRRHRSAVHGIARGLDGPLVARRSAAGGMGPRGRGLHGVALGQWTVQSRAMGLGKPRWRRMAGLECAVGRGCISGRVGGSGQCPAVVDGTVGSPWPLGTAAPGPPRVALGRMAGQRARGRSAALLELDVGRGLPWGGARGFALAAVARGGSVGPSPGGSGMADAVPRPSVAAPNRVFRRTFGHLHLASALWVAGGMGRTGGGVARPVAPPGLGPGLPAGRRTGVDRPVGCSGWVALDVWHGPGVGESARPGSLCDRLGRPGGPPVSRPAAAGFSSVARSGRAVGMPHSVASSMV